MNETPARLSISDLWRIDGTVGRGRYFFLGSLLCSVKFGIDSAVSWFIFHKPWSMIDYFIPGQALDVVSTSPELRAYYATMLVVALPFIWSGVVLTLRRLRAANLPAWLVKLFFVPLVNLLLFFVLCSLPNRADETTLTGKLTAQEPAAISEETSKPPAPAQPISEPTPALDDARSRKIFGHPTAPGQDRLPLLARILPQEFFLENRFASGLMAILLPQPAAYALIFMGTMLFRSYGWGLFVGIPFALGMTTVVLYGRKHPRKLVESLIVSWLALCLLSIALLVYAVEGVVCILMASPIAFVITSMGATLGWAIQRRPPRPNESTLMRLSIFLFLPFLMGAEYAVAPPAPLFAVRSTIDIHAPPQAVWNNVIAFSKLPPPTEPIFRTGIAYPVRAKIYGRGVGAVRHCIFSTGPFVEPIEVWDEPHRLKFGVTAQPQPMFETSFHKHVEPPHLDGFLRSRQGQFLLTTLPDGGTRLEGTTWYQHHMWPAGYWRLWSDTIIHEIHMRVLRHIKHLSEQGT